MPTTAESRALAFFAGLFALGGLLRVAATLRPAPPAQAAADSAALAGQLARVDTARAQPARGGRPRGRARPGSSDRAGADTGTGSAPDGMPPELAAVTGWFTRRQPDGVPSRPILTRAGERPATRNAPTAAPRPLESLPSAPLDLDAADAVAIEALPGIGPSLARRLVADRAAHGAFGSLAGLSRVKGVGPVLLARLAPHVTFSGAARPE